MAKTESDQPPSRALHVRILVAGFALFILFLNLSIGSPSITGHISGVPMDAQKLDITIEGHKEFTVAASEGDGVLGLKTVRLSGKVIGPGDVGVYIYDASGKRRLIYTNRLASSMASITGLATAKEGALIDGTSGFDPDKVVGEEYFIDPLSDDEIYEVIEGDISSGAGVTRDAGVIWLVDKAVEHIDVALTLDEEEKQAKEDKYAVERELEEESFFFDRDKIYSNRLSFTERETEPSEEEDPTQPNAPETEGVPPITGGATSDPLDDPEPFVPIDDSVQYIFKDACLETCLLDPSDFTSNGYVIEFDVAPGTKLEVRELLYFEE